MYIYIYVFIGGGDPRLPVQVDDVFGVAARWCVCVLSACGVCVDRRLSVASVRPNVVPCFNLVLSLREPPTHTFRALEKCWHAGDCPATSAGRPAQQTIVLAKGTKLGHGIKLGQTRCYRWTASSASPRVGPPSCRPRPPATSMSSTKRNTAGSSGWIQSPRRSLSSHRCESYIY